MSREQTQKIKVDYVGYQKVNSKTGKLETPRPPGGNFD